MENSPQDYNDFLDEQFDDETIINVYHSQEGIMTCSDCDYKTTYLTNFKAHRISKHGTGYKCSKCDQVFSSRGSLTNHGRAIHEGLRFHCNECDFTATQNHTLKSHKMKKHE